MDDWQKRFNGEEEEPEDQLQEDAPCPEDGDTAPEPVSDPFESCLDVTKYDELIKQIRPALFEIATARIRGACPDPMTHREDVVQQGIQKFLQAVRSRKTDYPEPAAVLRAAVYQEGVRHSQTCPRERAVDFNELSPRSEEPDASRQAGFSPDELTRKTSFNPTEVLDGLLDIRKQLKKVTDPGLFVMRFVEERTLEEIAKRRGCSVMTVQRAVEKLKKELGMLDKERPPKLGPKS